MPVLVVRLYHVTVLGVERTWDLVVVAITSNDTGLRERQSMRDSLALGPSTISASAQHQE